MFKDQRNVINRKFNVFAIGYGFYFTGETRCHASHLRIYKKKLIWYSTSNDSPIDFVW